MRALNLVDYSLCNEFDNIKRPSGVQLTLGKMLCGFICLVKQCSDAELQTIQEKDWSWHSMQQYVRKNISCSMYSFKDSIKQVLLH